MPWPTILPPGLPVGRHQANGDHLVSPLIDQCRKGRGEDLIVILSSRVLGVWGTGKFGDGMRGFRIIFGLDRLESGGDGIFREKRIVLMECLDIDKMGTYSLRSIPPSVQGCALDVMINQSKNGRRKKFQNKNFGTNSKC